MKTAVTLNSDVSRCVDETCPIRETCLRFLCRADDGYISAVSSLRAPNTNVCYYYIGGKQAKSGLRPFNVLVRNERVTRYVVEAESEDEAKDLITESSDADKEFGYKDVDGCWEIIEVTAQ